MTTSTLTPPGAMSDRPAIRADCSSRGSTDDAVVVDGLTKRFGKRAAVDDLSFTVPRGAVAGLIGPNGAGKTTLMAMLLGLVRRRAGPEPCSAIRSTDRPSTSTAPGR